MLTSILLHNTFQLNTLICATNKTILCYYFQNILKQNGCTPMDTQKV